jgi:hypothetical protein
VIASDYYFGQAHPSKIYIGQPKSITILLTKREANLLASAIRKAAGKHSGVSLAIYPAKSPKRKPQISVLGSSLAGD